MGLNGVVMNIGGIVFQMLGGILCAVNWRYTFFTYLLGLLSLILVFFLLPEPQKFEAPAGPAGAAPEKVKIPGSVYGWSLLIAVWTLMMYPMLTGMSSLILANNYGTAAGAGVALTFFTVGGMAAGAIFGAVYKRLTRFCIPVGLVLMTAAFALLAWGTNLTMLTIATALYGIGNGIASTAIMMFIGASVPPSATAFAMSIMMAFMSIGGFLSAYFFALIQGIFQITSLRFPFQFSVVGFAVFTVIFLIINLKPKPQASGTPAGMGQ
jgi:predicted MFS family arabinose efflux permease